jgi:hypothetical protein
MLSGDKENAILSAIGPMPATQAKGIKKALAKGKRSRREILFRIYLGKGAKG